MKAQPPIPLHGKELQDLGVELKAGTYIHEGMRHIHRDEHYVFLLLTEGTFLLEIDFIEWQVTAPALCFITPGQVHRYIRQDHHSDGWFLFADPGLVRGKCRDIFENYQRIQQQFPIPQPHAVFLSMPVLQHALEAASHPLKKQIVSSLAEGILGLFAAEIMQHDLSHTTANNQRQTITTKFRKLVKKRFKDQKQVQQYAELLHITPLYLNECVKATTGFPASHWISEEILLEARRLLYYTRLDARQIAFELGYEDAAYFSRLFKKHTSMTPLAFRAQNHELSKDAH
ncbi:helix-turn-helix domain-containing protein [Chitinophaga sp. G-6-1-13]|uniref:Helix-turn-helix domain-containing protein n=1 Tax=Chitinophaga fulva TaxID=2728842 RepID=A0A848GSC2_9BACT|nr:helix-turn-helix domain-containing protein [Chitinophaga fulva]NML40259.1 helix-turn-helix domain-containing protein [Chitinophaga fulva]